MPPATEKIRKNTGIAEPDYVSLIRNSSGTRVAAIVPFPSAQRPEPFIIFTALLCVFSSFALVAVPDC
jgi:hypothetical protein